MKYGMNLPNFGSFGNIDQLVRCATEAEDAGWDGFFIWDHMLIFNNPNPPPMVDPWVALSAIACNTSVIRLGPLVTPLPRRRPWKVAREAASVDHLSKGRLIFGAGIGAPPEVEFAAFGEEPNARIRAEKLDEGLDILQGLWMGEPFSYHGKHYRLDEMTFIPRPHQKSIPIWIGGGVPHKAPFRRAARFNGVAPVHSNWPEPVEPEHLVPILDIIKEKRGSLNDFDVVISGETSGTDGDADREKIQTWEDVGVNWWLEDINNLRATFDPLLERIRAGPPVA